MRSESFLIFLISLVITTGVVSAAYYFTVSRPTKPEPTFQTPAVGKEPAEHVLAPDVRGDKIIKCVDPGVGEFYTNALSCDKADLKQRLSMAPSIGPVKTSQKGVGVYKVIGQPPSDTPQTQSNPSLRSFAKHPPRGMVAECRFPVGQAAELERRMGGKDNPKESMWIDDYCRWRQEVRKLNCELPSDFFYHSYFEVCR